MLFVCLHIYVNIEGKSLAIAKLQETFRRKAKIGSLTTAFPITVHVKNIEVEGLFRIDEVVADGGLFKVIHPVVTIENSSKDSPPFLIPSFIPIPSYDLDLKKKTANAGIIKGRFLFPRCYIDNLIISNGIFNFIDKSIDNDGVLFKIEDMNINVENLNFTGRRSKVTSFRLKGKIPWAKGRQWGRIEAKGWLNLFKKDIRATVKIENFDGISLYPYYSKWVGLQKTRIESARFNFTSNINGLNNNVTADCRLELDDIVFKELTSKGLSQDKAVEASNAIMDIFKALNKGKVIFNFTLKTNMDGPKSGLGLLQGMIDGI